MLQLHLHSWLNTWLQWIGQRKTESYRIIVWEWHLCYLHEFFIVEYFPQFLNTVECHYNAVQHNMILHMARQWLRQNVHLRIYSQKAPHISPFRASYGLSFVRIWVKIDHVLTASYCMTIRIVLMDTSTFTTTHYIIRITSIFHSRIWIQRSVPV